jgi:hypothetical protein
VLETAAGDILRRRGVGTPVEAKGLAGCRAPARCWDAGGGKRARRRTGHAGRR